MKLAGPALTRNQQAVLDVLSQATAPLSAYGILDVLRPAGFRAPLQVYRALDKLVETGLAHRIESMNAFVACASPEDIHPEAIVFMLCEKCGQTVEVADHKVAHRIDELCRMNAFHGQKQTIEIRGLCARCAQAA
ncbi:MAG: Fur family transcriptional regulator [Flavobacteriaceae bacterium]